jgi:hypothetical protein
MTHFIVRKAFFGQAAKTKEGLLKLREEYIENLQNNDFALAPRGDANASTRFFEALSLGRIPILIDTDIVLPLERIIDYSKFVVRIDHTQLHRLPEILLDFYEKISDDEFVAMQYRAREAYVKHLRLDSFFNTALAVLKERGPEGL